MGDYGERDLWLMAIGAAMADESLRPLLTGNPPAGLGDLARAVRDGDAKVGWAELKRWGVRPEGEARPAQRVLARLAELESRRARLRLVEEMRAALLAGYEDVYESKRSILEERTDGRQAH